MKTVNHSAFHSTRSFLAGSYGLADRNTERNYGKHTGQSVSDENIHSHQESVNHNSNWEFPVRAKTIPTLALSKSGSKKFGRHHAVSAK